MIRLPQNRVKHSFFIKYAVAPSRVCPISTYIPFHVHIWMVSIFSGCAQGPKAPGRDLFATMAPRTRIPTAMVAQTTAEGKEQQQRGGSSSGGGSDRDSFQQALHKSLTHMICDIPVFCSSTWCHHI